MNLRQTATVHITHMPSTVGTQIASSISLSSWPTWCSQNGMLAFRQENESLICATAIPQKCFGADWKKVRSALHRMLNIHNRIVSSWNSMSGNRKKKHKNKNKSIHIHGTVRLFHCVYISGARKLEKFHFYLLFQFMNASTITVDTPASRHAIQMHSTFK